MAATSIELERYSRHTLLHIPEILGIFKNEISAYLMVSFLILSKTAITFLAFPRFSFENKLFVLMILCN